MLFLSTYKKTTVFDIDSPRPNDFKMSVGFLKMAHYTLKYILKSARKCLIMKDSNMHHKLYLVKYAKKINKCNFVLKITNIQKFN